jgi:hypothetical protein
MKAYRALSCSRDFFRNDGWAQAVKNLSAVSIDFTGNRVAEEWHFMDGRPRNLTKTAESHKICASHLGWPKRLGYYRPSEFRLQIELLTLKPPLD